MVRNGRDHGGGLDAAVATYGGVRRDWIDLSTGINPAPYPIPTLPPAVWADLPDVAAYAALDAAARSFWDIPSGADVLAVPGCSAAIAQIPGLNGGNAGTVGIPTPTYNEHAASFTAWGWDVRDVGQDATVLVHPNNPTGHFYTPKDIPQTPLTVIDESFCDTAPERSFIAQSGSPGVLVLKSFGKFWGLAGVRLGFVIGDAALVQTLRERLGPWQVSGPALAIGTKALSDTAWAAQTRTDLRLAAARLDRLMGAYGGDTPLFRTYRLDTAAALHRRLAQAHIWTRVFPYDTELIRFGLPPQGGWTRLEAAL